MTRRRFRQRYPRVLEAPEVLRILSRGGILFESDAGIWSVYRNPDARGLRVGIVEEALPEWLLAEGHARHVPGVKGGFARLVAAPPD